MAILVLIVVGFLLLVGLLSALGRQSSNALASATPVRRIIPQAKKKGWFARWRITPETRITEAWERLAVAAHESPNRVAVIRRNCEKARVQLKNSAFEPDSQDLLVILERRVPEWIEGRLERLADISERDANAHLHVTLELLEEVAARCERNLSTAHIETFDDDAALAIHIKRQLKLGALSIED